MFTAELLEGWLKECATNSADVELAKPWLPSIAKLLNAYGQALSLSRDENDVKVMLQNLGFALRTGVPSTAELKEKIVGWLKDQYVEPPAPIDAILLDARTTLFPHRSIDNRRTCIRWPRRRSVGRSPSCAPK
jgi:hypothetical protein